MSEGVQFEMASPTRLAGVGSYSWSAADAATTPAAEPAPSLDLSFGDVLSALNPLQHLPVIGTIYRAITGDRIQPPLRIAGSVIGGFIAGGPLGVLGSIVSTFVEEFIRMGPNMPDSNARSVSAIAEAGLATTPIAVSANAAMAAPAAAGGPGGAVQAADPGRTEYAAALAAYRSVTSWAPG